MPIPNIPRSRRSESVAEKLSLLARAHRDKRYDLVESLADSIKDSVQYDRQAHGPEPSTDSSADTFLRVVDLPRPWATWAAGWKYCKPLRFFETVGIDRTREPVELLIGFRSAHITDPNREIRVARVDPETGALMQVPSQVWDDMRVDDRRLCRLAFQADVRQHGDAAYLVFYGNPLAELTSYPSDLQVEGNDWKLDIENEYFVAKLSQEMGQLERITSKHEHGLELYAGGKGHGEPPTIDWAHDYVEEGGYQKLRMKDWGECRNYQVIRGPVCTHVRRWGFPHSPIHPVITPSRMHISVLYSFWSGLPVFFKHANMEALVDFRIEAMRDDEWVFSGYSFTKSLWIDRAGKLHEGAVPARDQQDLWGVGFANETSQDAFVALWLRHDVSGRDGLDHGGAPTLHYPGHGQLWSRYPAQGTELTAGTTFHQRNAYLLTSWDSESSSVIERERHRWMNPLELSSDTHLPRPTNPVLVGRLARTGETAETAGPKQEIWNVLREVRDDQLYDVDANVVDLGYVYDVRFVAGVAHVVVTMPHRGRPVHEFLVTQGGGRVTEGIRERVARIPGVNSVAVSTLWNPPWSIARVTEQGRRAIGLS